MTLDELVEQLEPIVPAELEAEVAESGVDSVYDSLAEMITLAERAAKSGYRAGQSTELVSQRVGELRDFMEAEVETREKDLRRARSEIGSLVEERDRVVQAQMEVADLVASASDAAAHELDAPVSERFHRLESHIAKVLHRAGLESVAEEGQAFDPEYHEAIDQVVDADADPRTIVQVVRQGYRYRGEAVRIARVIIAE